MFHLLVLSLKTELVNSQQVSLTRKTIIYFLFKWDIIIITLASSSISSSLKSRYVSRSSIHLLLGTKTEEGNKLLIWCHFIPSFSLIKSQHPLLEIKALKIFLHIYVLSLKSIKKSEYPFTYKRRMNAAVLTSLGENYWRLKVFFD